MHILLPFLTFLAVRIGHVFGMWLCACIFMSWTVPSVPKTLALGLSAKFLSVSGDYGLDLDYDFALSVCSFIQFIC